MPSIMERMTGRNKLELTQLKECECSAEGLRVTTASTKLWDDRVFWTREAIVALTTGDLSSPQVTAAVSRLLRNQEEIGDLLVPYYGRLVADNFVQLLKEDVMRALDLAVALKEGSAEKQTRVKAAWQSNADKISELLSESNPVYWPGDAVSKMIGSHIRLTIDLAASAIAMDWERSVQDFDLAREETLRISDALVQGMMMQFPDKFISMAVTGTR